MMTTNQTVTTKDELHLTLLTETGETIQQNLKNPVANSSNISGLINVINSSLAGGMSGMWLSDQDGNAPITKISKAVRFNQGTFETPIYKKS